MWIAVGKIIGWSVLKSQERWSFKTVLRNDEVSSHILGLRVLTPLDFDVPHQNPRANYSWLEGIPDRPIGRFQPEPEVNNLVV